MLGGWCGKTVEKAVKVVRGLPELDEEAAKRIKDILNNRGVGPAFRALRQARRMSHPSVRRHEQAFEVLVALPAWSGLDARDVRALPVGEVSDLDALLFLWSDPGSLPTAFDTLRAWYFTYLDTLTWVRDFNTKAGQALGQATHCLVGVRSAWAPNSCWRAKAHALWQDGVGDLRRLRLFWDYVEEQFPDHRALLFANGPREGWTAFDGRLRELG